MISLKGYKTKISAVMVIVAGILFGLGVIDLEGLTAMVAVFSGTGLYGLRDAM